MLHGPLEDVTTLSVVAVNAQAGATGAELRDSARFVTVPGEGATKMATAKHQ